MSAGLTQKMRIGPIISRAYCTVIYIDILVLLKLNSKV